MNQNTNQSTSNSEFEISLIPLLKLILKRIWLIIIVGLIIGAVTFCAAKIFIKPIYRCGFTAYINNKQTQQNTDVLTVSDVNASTQIVRTYKKTLTSARILNGAAESAGIQGSYDSFRKMVSAESQNDTQIITIYVDTTDPQLSFEFAKSIANTAPAQMSEIVEGSSMKIIDNPQYSEKRFKPDYLRYGIIGFFIGALLVIVLVIIRYFMDDTVKNEGEIESKFALPILGVIPDITKASNKRSDYYYYEQNNETEKVNISESEQKNEEK